MATEGPSPLDAFAHPAAVLYLRSVGQQRFKSNRGNVMVKLDRQGTPPLIILLPYTAEEARLGRGGDWATTWHSIRTWPGAPGLKQEQWLLLWTLCRTLNWFAQPDNAGRADMWPGFMTAYLLLGEVGRYFTFTRPIKEDLLLRFLHTWVRERIPEVFLGPSPGIELPEFVLERAQEVRAAKRVRRA